MKYIIMMDQFSQMINKNTVKIKASTIMATAALAGIGYFTLVVIALHLLRSDLDISHRYISEYAIGHFGWLMTSAFYGLSLGSLALTIALYQRITIKGRSWLGLVLLSMWALGIMVAGIFKADLITAPETQEGNIHSQNSQSLYSIHIF